MVEKFGEAGEVAARQPGPAGGAYERLAPHWLALSRHMARRDRRWVRQQLREIRLDEIRGQAVRILLGGLILEDAGREHDAFVRVVHKVIGDEAPMLADQRTKPSRTRFATS